MRVTGLAVSGLAWLVLLWGTAARADVGDYFEHWYDRVEAAQSSQPHWITPVAIVTPRLEQEFRYDQYWEHQGTGGSVNLFDSGKGLELIPTTTNEVLINLPAYEERSVKKPADGWGDWPFLVVKQRFLSENETGGNYIVSGFLGVQAPTGSAAFTNHAWVVTPTLAGGKGWGDFDIQATVGFPLPLSDESTIGTSMATNVTFQYHLWTYFWPEFEVNDTYWMDGQRGGRNQMFLTPGIVFGRFELPGRAKFILGTAYQFALSPPFTTKPALTPLYQHGWILSARVAF
jgi:hypothetical protein